MVHAFIVMKRAGPGARPGLFHRTFSILPANPYSRVGCKRRCFIYPARRPAEGSGGEIASRWSLAIGDVNSFGVDDNYSNNIVIYIREECDRDEICEHS